MTTDRQFFLVGRSRDWTVYIREPAAVRLGAMLESKPAQQMMRVLSESASPGEADAEEAPHTLGQGKCGADPSEAEYKRLYEYNLGLTGDRVKVEAEYPPDSPLQGLFRGQSVKIDPTNLREALTLGMASARRKPTKAADVSPKAFRYMLWIVIALSAGAIAAATLAFR